MDTAGQFSTKVIWKWLYQTMQGFFQRGGICPRPPPWICWEFYFTCKSIQAFIKALITINGKNCVCENSPRFHEIVSNKRSKIKISQGNMPPDALVCRPLCTQMCTCPPLLNNPYNLIPLPLAKKPCHDLISCRGDQVLPEHHIKHVACS